MTDQGRKHLKKALTENSYYVLVTCSEPLENGEMRVELSYQGGPDLVSYLLQGALEHVNDQEEEEEDILQPVPELRVLK